MHHEYQWDRFRMHEILKLEFFRRKFSRRFRTVWGACTQKNRTQIEVLDQKILRFRPSIVGGHTSTSRLLSILLLTVGHGWGSFCASSRRRDEISTGGLILFVRCLAARVCQTAQGNMIWASVVSEFDWKYLKFASFDIACILNLSNWFAYTCLCRCILVFYLLFGIDDSCVIMFISHTKG